jgi:hypothetical protein
MTADRRAALVEKVAAAIRWKSMTSEEIATAAIALIRAKTLEEAARVADSYEPRCDTCPRGVAAAIRALKEKP